MGEARAGSEGTEEEEAEMMAEAEAAAPPTLTPRSASSDAVQEGH